MRSLLFILWRHFYIQSAKVIPFLQLIPLSSQTTTLTCLKQVVFARPLFEFAPYFSLHLSWRNRHWWLHAIPVAMRYFIAPVANTQACYHLLLKKQIHSIMKRYFSFPLALSFILIISSCTKSNIEPEPSIPYQKIGEGYATAAATKVEMNATQRVATGYKTI